MNVFLPCKYTHVHKIYFPPNYTCGCVAQTRRRAPTPGRENRTRQHAPSETGPSTGGIPSRRLTSLPAQTYTIPRSALHRPEPAVRPAYSGRGSFSTVDAGPRSVGPGVRPCHPDHSDCPARDGPPFLAPPSGVPVPPTSFCSPLSAALVGAVATLRTPPRTETSRRAGRPARRPR